MRAGYDPNILYTCMKINKEDISQDQEIKGLATRSHNLLMIFIKSPLRTV